MRRLSFFLGAAAILTIIFGTIYTVVQQAQRSEANYPQIQMAEDTATALNQHADPQAVANGRVAMAASLAPFTIIYNKSGQAVAGSGYLDDRLANAPLGILTAANASAYHAVTWQPRAGVRIAAITVSADHYYVLAGRSLTEVERAENHTFQLSALGWLASLAVLAFACVFRQRQPAG